MKRGAALVAVCGALLLGTLLVVVPATLGGVTYTSRPDCVRDISAGLRAPDDAFAIQLREGETVEIVRPDAPHEMLLESDGAPIARAGDARTSFGYRTHGCGGGTENVRAHADGTLHVSVWRLDR